MLSHVLTLVIVIISTQLATTVPADNYDGGNRRPAGQLLQQKLESSTYEEADAYGDADKSSWTSRRYHQEIRRHSSPTITIDEHDEGENRKFAAGRRTLAVPYSDDGKLRNEKKKKDASTMSYVYYVDSCPRAYDMVREKMQLFVNRDAANAAAILHLFFNDCFLQGCDASVLLLDLPLQKYSRRSKMAIHMVNDIKAYLEATCPGIVSCADTLALAARDAIFLVGGPWIPIKTGRKDRSKSALSTGLTQGLIPPDLPRPTQGFPELKRLFQIKGLNVPDLVALSGAHTIGQTHCHVVAETQKLVPTDDPSSDLSPLFAANLSRICLRQQQQQQLKVADDANNKKNEKGHDRNHSSSRSRHNYDDEKGSSVMIDGHVSVHLDGATPDVFDNAYFRNVLAKQAIFHSDAALLDDPQAMAYVRLFARNQTLFFTHFRLAFSKMSQLGVLTSSSSMDPDQSGGRAEIRLQCTHPN